LRPRPSRPRPAGSPNKIIEFDVIDEMIGLYRSAAESNTRAAAA
jgi:hypothetical protein